MRSFTFGSDKALADHLEDLVLSGKKVATTGLWCEGKELEKVGEQNEIVGSDGKPFCRIEYTGIAVRPFLEVDFEYAQKEGEGEKDIGEWREKHREFFKSEYGDFTDHSLVVCCEFKLVEVL